MVDQVSESCIRLDKITEREEVVNRLPPGGLDTLDCVEPPIELGCAERIVSDKQSASVELLPFTEREAERCSPEEVRLPIHERSS